jgi:spore coat protein H
MKNIITAVFVAIAVLFLAVVSLQSLTTLDGVETRSSQETPVVTPRETAEFEERVNINDLPFEDNMALYRYDDPGSVVYMYLTVRKGNSSDNTDHTWQEVNEFTKWFFVELRHVEVGKAEAILQIGDENGPIPGEIGYEDILPNATVQIRGASTSTADQKSYKIELKDDAGIWRGQSTIALNKHPYDILRVKNKLSFDLMKDIPHLVSLRTQFVRLYVKDETSDPPSEEFVDYGLFTQVEQPNKAFLRNHMLDPDGQLYKANFFEFFRYEENLQPNDSPIYDVDKFNEVLEIKGNPDHRKLVQMLEDVNDWKVPINDVFDKYFDSENYFTWLAFNILVGNVDTQTQNFYLYSPKNSDTWYFLPWDYDGAFARQEREALGHQDFNLYAHGISNYWGVVLHNRVLRFEKNRKLLDDKINELRTKYLAPQKIGGLLAIYRESTEELVFQPPDVVNLPGTITEYELQYDLMTTEVQANYKLYLESLEKPMPFFLGTPLIVGGKLAFNWGESYDFDAEDIKYHFIISKDVNFEEVIYETDLLRNIYIQIDMLDEGTYFWRVTATNESGFIQYPFDFFKDEEGVRHSGMKYLQITSAGQVLEE